jgi:hypothetical protein
MKTAAAEWNAAVIPVVYSVLESSYLPERWVLRRLRV